MTQRSASFQASTRLAAAIAAAGLLFVSAAAAQTALPPPQYGSADARQDRLEELERQLRDATAENERLQHELNQRDREIQRLRSMVGELAGVNQQLATPPADGFAPATGGTPPNAPRADAGPAPSGLNSAQQANTGTLGTIPADSAQPAAPAPPTADELYASAQAHLNAGRYADAEVDFAAFLEAYPNVTQTANARFWYAYTLLARNNYRDAAENFLTYLRRAPRAPRAAEAQVRLGMALIGMGEREQGCAAFASLAQRYPNAAQNVRDLAAREARAARCAA
ncbi:MAG: tol-pal system protein YbgF [Caulobacteraceae bacterium]